jgi:tetratricopeptide (TPR) repeat protein
MEMEGAQPNLISWLEVLYRAKGQFLKAREQAQLGLELSQQNNNKATEGNFRMTLAHLFWRMDESHKAWEEIEKARKIWEDTFDTVSKQEAMFYKGMIGLEVRSPDTAQAIADELKREVESSIHLRNLSFYYHLLGRIEAKRENYTQAIDHFEMAYSLLPAPRRLSLIEWHALFVFPLGEAFYKSGNLEKAQEEFQKITLMTTGRAVDGDLYAKSYYMLGKINEELGETAKAITHYEKFLDLWMDADPGIAEVEDARKRLAGLKGE